MRTTTRKKVASYRCARRKLQKTWGKLRGFLSKHVTLNGPASDDDMSRLKDLIHPWVLPPALLASWKLHDGEWERSQGMYMGSRMLTIQEIVADVNASCTEAESLRQGDSSNGSLILRIPLFSASRARQVAMELRLDSQNGTNAIHGYDYRDMKGRLRQANNIYRSGSDDECNAEIGIQNGTIVLVSSLLPFVPRVKVLATSWEGFLTLV
mmetsp:Transcript_22947/g.54260  ORF Transcript_22947/g.54260 Transcript_22947/m.54260 type:complete len:210 (-) Transcript_22947:12-641(-)